MRLLIVDDDEVVRRGVRSLLSEQTGWDVCGEAVDGQDAIDKARELKPDLIVMDVSMPRLNGLEATQQVRSMLPDCEVLVLSQHENSEMARQALQAGARGYVVKSSISRDLLSAVAKASRHEYFFDPAILDQTSSAHTDVQEILQRSAAFEKALRESEEHLHLVTRSMAASVTRCSRDLRYLWVNEGYAEWLHRRPEHFINQRIEDVLGKDGFAKLLPYFERVLSGERVAYEEEVIFQSIGPRWISATYTPTLDAAGSADGWVAVVWDITERKRTETAIANGARQQKALFHLADELHRAGSLEEVYAAALNAILDALQCNRASILLCDSAGVMRFQSWRGLSNEYRAAVDGHSAWKKGDPNPQPVCINDVSNADLMGSLKATVRKEGIGSLAFIPLVSKGKLIGKFMTYFNTPHTFTDEEIEISLTIARQLTFAIERMHGIEALRNSDKATALLAAIVASSDDAIVSKNLDGIITSWNKGAERVFGYTAEEAIGHHITLVIPADRLAEEEDILARLRRGQKIDHFQTVRKQKDGTLIDVSLTISPVQDSTGRIIGASKVARDITVQKRTAEKIRIADESLRLMRVQDEERRRIAREFHDSAGQTLTVLGLSLAQLIQNAEVIAPELAKEGKEIEGVVQQLHREIRTTSYLLHPPLLDEAGLRSALSWYVQGIVDRSGIAIDLSISDDFGRLPADMELAIFRVVQECLTNVHRHAESKTAFIRITRENGSVYIEVRDEGKGISPQRLAEIQARGSGVGIAGIRERLRQFGGELNIEATGSGTRVVAQIPLSKEIAPKEMEPFQAAV